MVIFLFWSDCVGSYKNQYTPLFFFVFCGLFNHLYMKKQIKTKNNSFSFLQLNAQQYLTILWR